MNHKLMRAAVAAAGVGALALTAAPGPATAMKPATKADDGLTVVYKAQGTTTVKKTNSTLTIAPTRLVTTLAQDSTLTGHMRIAPAQTEFKVLGLVPVKATVNFKQAKKLTGKLTRKSGGGFTAAATAYYTLRLSDATAAGLPLPVGDHCQTVTPVALAAATPEGQSFDLTKGGTLSGTFTIPNFANCNLQENLINQLVPGPDNTATLQVSNGKVKN